VLQREAKGRTPGRDGETRPGNTAGKTSTASVTQSDRQRKPYVLFQLPDVIRCGERRRILPKYAASLRARGQDRDAILAELRRVNSTRCEQPVPDSGLTRIAAWAATKAVSTWRRDPETVAMVRAQIEAAWAARRCPARRRAALPDRLRRHGCPAADHVDPCPHDRPIRVPGGGTLDRGAASGGAVPRSGGDAGEGSVGTQDGIGRRGREKPRGTRP
jgi:hypothetical protein